MFPDDIVSLILQAIPAEKIFLLGTTKSFIKTESVYFETIAGKNPLVRYYILILIPKEVDQNFSIVQEIIEGRCMEICPVTVLAMQMEMFNEWLEAGHPFAVPIKLNAKLLFDKGNIPLVIHHPVNRGALKSFNKIHFSKGINRMQELMKANEFYEAAICGLQTLIKTSVSIEVETMDFEKLVYYSRITFPELPIEFSDKKSFALKLETMLQLLQMQ
ncbi:MAG: hypothetical protein ABI581_05145 [Sediminibacterium sp.]